MMNLFKTRIFSIFSMALLATGFVACSSDDNSTTESTVTETTMSVNGKGEISIDKIVEDSVFKDWYIEFINNSEKTIDTEKLKGFMADGELTEDELKTGFKSYGFETYGELESSINDQIQRLVTIEKRYKISKFNEEKMYALFELANIKYARFILTGKNCERKRRNCRISANLTAGLGHAGCVSLDLTVVGGILCHGAVMTIHYLALDDCDLEYEDCIN